MLGGEPGPGRETKGNEAQISSPHRPARVPVSTAVSHGSTCEARGSRVSKASPRAEGELGGASVPLRRQRPGHAGRRGLRARTLFGHKVTADCSVCVSSARPMARTAGRGTPAHRVRSSTGIRQGVFATRGERMWTVLNS